MIKIKVLAALLLAGYAGTGWATESSSNLALGVEPSYSDGKYGTSADTKIFYLPFYAKYQDGDLGIKLTVPYISVESTGAVLSGGTVIGHKGKSGATASPTTESGLGDVWLDGRYRIHGTGGASPDFVPYAKVKFGTASSSRGLGTGENDYEGGLGLEWAVAENWFPFVTAGYRFVGSPAGLNLSDFATYDGGVMYRVSQTDYLTAMFTGHGSAQAGTPAAADAMLAWNHRMGGGIGLQAFLDKGLSNGSPDYAAGVGLEKRF
ncbi:MAG: hypothetical protein M0Z73_13280 [Betaproteobacteria bacterium]|nr:hypothetical protein [Betaproteobacteria bacterium]